MPEIPEFLDLNGVCIAHSSPGLHELTLGVAEGRVTKSAAAEAFRRIAQSH